MRLKLTGVYYGWWIVGACFLINMTLGGLVILSFTAFFEPIVNEFGWSYAQISLASSLRGVEAGVLAPLLGLVVDRWGPRRLMFAGVAVLGLGYILLSRTTSLSMFYLAFAVIALGSSGLSPTVMMTGIANWFRKKIGIATGIMGSGFAIGSLLIPLVVRLIDAVSWQTAILILAGLIWIIGFPFTLVIRHRPEKYGYVVDGSQDDTSIPSQSGPSMPVEERDFKMSDVLRSRVFWHISLTMTLPFLVISAITVHIMPYLATVDFSRSISSIVATAVPLMSIAGRLTSGWLLDRFNKVKIASVFITMSFIGIVFLYFVSYDNAWLLCPFVIAYGIGWGGNATIRTALIRGYFGRRKFGMVFGLMMGMVAFGGIIGPFIAGWMYDNFNNYHSLLLLFACLIFIAVIFIATTPRKSPFVRSASYES
jgi:MFS family permease